MAQPKGCLILARVNGKIVPYENKGQTTTTVVQSGVARVGGKIVAYCGEAAQGLAKNDQRVKAASGGMTFTGAKTECTQGGVNRSGGGRNHRRLIRGY